MLLIACIFVGVFRLNSAQNTISSFYEGAFTAKGTAKTIKVNFEAMQKSVFRAIANDDPSIMQDSFNDVDTASAVIQENLPIVEKLFSGDPQIITNLQDNLADLDPQIEKVSALAREMKNAEAVIYMEKSTMPLMESAAAELDKVVNLSNENAETLIDDLNKAQTQAIIFLILMGVISVIIAVIFGVYITRSIVKPVAELEAAAEDLSKGKLDL